MGMLVVLVVVAGAAILGVMSIVALSRTVVRMGEQLTSRHHTIIPIHTGQSLAQVMVAPGTGPIVEPPGEEPPTRLTDDDDAFPPLMVEGRNMGELLGGERLP